MSSKKKRTTKRRKLPSKLDRREASRVATDAKIDATKASLKKAKAKVSKLNTELRRLERHRAHLGRSIGAIKGKAKAHKDTISKVASWLQDDANEKPLAPKLKRPTVRLVGIDGNAMTILSRVTMALRRAGYPEAEVKRYTEQAMAGDYNHLLMVTLQWVDAADDEESDDD